MNIHFIIQSHFYTPRIVKKVNTFSIDNQIFIIVRSYNDVSWIDGENAYDFNFSETIKRLKTLNIQTSYIHFLSTSIAYLLVKSGLIHKKLIWFLWGADYYRIPDVIDEYFMPLAKKYIPTKSPILQKLKGVLSIPNYAFVKKTIQHCDYLAWHFEEFQLVQNNFNPNIGHIPFDYYFPISELKQISPSNKKTNRLLLGNSDDPTNNHLDVLNYIAPIIPKDISIIIPLAGATSKYISAIKAIAAKHDLQLELILETLDLDAFFNRISSVDYVIFGHLRQQGQGTIFPLIYAGIKTFMWEANPLFQTLQRWKVNIHALDTLKTNSFTALKDSEIEQNKSQLDFYMSKKRNTENWLKVLNA